MSKVSARVFVVISPLLARLFDVIIDHLLIYQLMYPVIYVCCCKVTNTTVTKKWRIRYYWTLSKRGVSSIFSIASPFCFLKDSCHVFFSFILTALVLGLFGQNASIFYWLAWGWSSPILLTWRISVSLLLLNLPGWLVLSNFCADLSPLVIITATFPPALSFCFSWLFSLAVASVFVSVKAAGVC